MRNFRVILLSCGSLNRVMSQIIEAKDVDEARKIGEEEVFANIPNKVNLFVGAEAI